jgi:hypothetical protein
VTGGAGRIPLAQDNVIINSSFNASQTLNVGMNIMGKDINFTGATGNITLAGDTNFIIYSFGNYTLASGMIESGFGAGHYLESRSPSTIKSNNASFGDIISMRAFNSTYSLADNFNSSAGLFLVAGTLDANNFNVTATNFRDSGSLARTLIMGNGTWNMTTTGFSFFSAGYNVSANNSLLILSRPTGAVAMDFPQANTTLNNVSLLNGTGIFTLTGNSTFNNFVVTAPRVLNFTAGTNQTFTMFNATGSAGNNITLQSNSTSAGATLTKVGGGTISGDYLNITQINVLPLATWYYGNNSVYYNGTGWNAGYPGTSRRRIILL